MFYFLKTGHALGARRTSALSHWCCRLGQGCGRHGDTSSLCSLRRPCVLWAELTVLLPLSYTAQGLSTVGILEVKFSTIFQVFDVSQIKPGHLCRVVARLPVGSFPVCDSFSAVCPPGPDGEELVHPLVPGTVRRAEDSTGLCRSGQVPAPTFAPRAVRWAPGARSESARRL